VIGWDPAWQRLVDERFGEPMPVVGALPDPMVSECAHVLVAYPFSRIAGLRHWRESATLAVTAGTGFMELNVWEISTWCRLIQRSHGRAVCASGEVALHDALGVMPALRAIAQSSVDEAAVRWAADFGIPEWPASGECDRQPAWESGRRFAALDAWVIQVRSLVSAG
jgi:hypothetical protein